MKYFNTLLEDQETMITILYKEQIIRVYSSETNTIQQLIKILGQPTTKYKKSKTYWSGASWDIELSELSKLKEIMHKELFTDNIIKVSDKKGKKEKSIKGETTKIEDFQAEKRKMKKTKSFEQIELII